MPVGSSSESFSESPALCRRFCIVPRGLFPFSISREAAVYPASEAVTSGQIRKHSFPSTTPVTRRFSPFTISSNPVTSRLPKSASARPALTAHPSHWPAPGALPYRQAAGKQRVGLPYTEMHCAAELRSKSVVTVSESSFQSARLRPRYSAALLSESACKTESGSSKRSSYPFAGRSAAKINSPPTASAINAHPNIVNIRFFMMPPEPRNLPRAVCPHR